MSYGTDFSNDMIGMSCYSKPANTPRVLAIGGGKGGVGKTIVATMLGICLSSMGKKTVIVDVDFDGANLHGYLNNWNESQGLNRYFQRKTYNLNDLAHSTIFKNLYMIRGVSGPLYARFKYWEKKKLIHAVRNIEADYVVLDLGAGTSYTTIDFFLSADDAIVVSSADPLAIQDTYGFLRVSILRRLERAFHESPEFMNSVIGCADLSQSNSALSMYSVLDKMEKMPLSWILLAKNLLYSFSPKIIINLVRETEPHHELQALKLAANDMLNIQLSLWGIIHYDPAVRAAIKNLRPELLLSANSPASEDVVRIVHRNVIARELNAHKMEGNGWAVKNENDEPFQHFRICSYRCIAWKCCADRNGGMPCAIMNQVPLSKVSSLS